jgi:hypothetical protein
MHGRSPARSPFFSFSLLRPIIIYDDIEERRQSTNNTNGLARGKAAAQRMNKFLPHRGDSISDSTSSGADDGQMDSPASRAASIWRRLSTLVVFVALSRSPNDGRRNNFRSAAPAMVDGEGKSFLLCRKLNISPPAPPPHYCTIKSSQDRISFESSNITKDFPANFSRFSLRALFMPTRLDWETFAAPSADGPIRTSTGMNFHELDKHSSGGEWRGRRTEASRIFDFISSLVLRARSVVTRRCSIRLCTLRAFESVKPRDVFSLFTARCAHSRPERVFHLTSATFYGSPHPHHQPNVLRETMKRLSSAQLFAVDLLRASSRCCSAFHSVPKCAIYDSSVLRDIVVAG